MEVADGVDDDAGKVDTDGADEEAGGEDGGAVDVSGISWQASVVLRA